MKLRKLRIAWSVFWGLAAVLLIVLWVRSYSVMDAANAKKSARDLGIQSVRGMIVIKWYVYQSRSRVAKPVKPSPVRWQARSNPIGDDYHHILQDHTSTLGFKYLDSKAQYYVVPHWFPVAVSAALGVIPWLRWSRRFTTSTLLIATTLVAVVLGLVMWSIR